MTSPPPASHRNRLLRAIVALGVMGAIGLTISWLRSSPSDEVAVEEPVEASAKFVLSAPGPVSHNYVGSEACAKCHADIAKKYHATPMANSMATVESHDVPELREKTEFSPVAALAYKVEFQDHKQIHHEIRKDAEGNVIYDQGVPVDYVFGSGKHGQTYVTNRAGRLYESMISWYTENHHWGLSPGYVPGFNARFERQASDACLNCHAGLMAPHESFQNRFQEKQPFLELALGCERCHGPGGDHVALREKGPLPSGTLDPIVNPVSFTDDRKDAVCNQCHLAGRLRVVTPGRSEFDFRPGMYLNDIWTTVVKTAGVESGQAAAVSQVEQMHASQCYKKSGGQLSCIDCHDVHDSPKADQKDAFFQVRCLNCHGAEKDQHQCTEKSEARNAAGDSCIKCHMPQFPARDVHAAQTDHRIPRRPAAPAFAPEDEAPSEEIKIFEEKGFTANEVIVDRAKGIFLAARAASRNDASLAAQALPLLLPVAENNPKDDAVFYALGQAYNALQQPAETQQAWQRVLEIRPTHEEAVESLAIHFHETKNLQQAFKYYKMAIDLNPTNSMYFGRLAHVLGQMGDIQNAKSAALKALELNPSLGQTHAWLAEIYRNENNEQAAEEHSKLAERFQSLSIKPDPDAK